MMAEIAAASPCAHHGVRCSSPSKNKSFQAESAFFSYDIFAPEKVSEKEKKTQKNTNKKHQNLPEVRAQSDTRNKEG